jgi:hypothetical protein
MMQFVLETTIEFKCRLQFNMYLVIIYYLCCNLVINFSYNNVYVAC